MPCRPVNTAVRYDTARNTVRFSISTGFSRRDQRQLEVDGSNVPRVAQASCGGAECAPRAPWPRRACSPARRSRAARSRDDAGPRCRPTSSSIPGTSGSKKRHERLGETFFCATLSFFHCGARTFTFSGPDLLRSKWSLTKMT